MDTNYPFAVAANYDAYHSSSGVSGDIGGGVGLKSVSSSLTKLIYSLER